MTTTPTAVGGSLSGSVMNLGPSTPGVGGASGVADLTAYTQYVLEEICSQEWVREKFLKNPEKLFNCDMLLDKMFSEKQVCYLFKVRTVHQSF